MNTILIALADVLREPAFPFVIEVVAKSTIVVLAALVLVQFLRKSAASLRHITLAVAFAALLALPLFVFLAPPLQISIDRSLLGLAEGHPAAPVEIPYAPIPDPNPASGSPAAIAPLAPERPLGAGSVVPAAPEGPAGVAAASGLASAMSWTSLALYLWLAGMIFVLFKTAMGYLAVRWLSRRAVPLRDQYLSKDVAIWRQALQITRPVKVVRSIYAIMPMTWGAFRPTIMLPSDSSEWSAERTRVVLLHELAHIKRFDWMIQMVAQLACAIYWFNPLAWKAAVELRRERELACDEAVLDAGARASDYAEHLLEIARAGAAPRYAPQAALAMARPSQLEDRLRAILDPRRKSSTRQRNAVALFVAVGIALPLLAARPMLVEDAAHIEGAALETASLPSIYGLPAVPSEEAHPPAEAYFHAASEDFHWRGTIAQGKSIEIKGVNGSVNASPTDGAQVEVRARKSGRLSAPEDVRIEVVEHGDGVTICAVYPGSNNECVPGGAGKHQANNNDVQVNFDVAVPAGVHFVARTTNGNISAVDMRGRVDAHAVNGNLRVSSSDFVTANTVNGNIDAAMGRTDWTRGVTLKTVNGQVKVTLPPTANLDVTAKLVNGNISSDFETVHIQRGEYTGAMASGRIGAGGPMLNLEAVNGNISLRRSSSAARIDGTRGSTLDLRTPHGVSPSAAAGARVAAPHAGLSRRGEPGGSFRFAVDEAFHTEIEGLVSELTEISQTLADSTLHADRRRELKARSERLEAMIEARAERLAALIEERMAELEPLIEEKSLAMAEEVLLPLMDRLERELPSLLEKLENELPALLDEIIESVSRSLRQD